MFTISIYSTACIRVLSLVRNTVGNSSSQIIESRIVFPTIFFSRVLFLLSLLCPHKHCYFQTFFHQSFPKTHWTLKYFSLSFLCLLKLDHKYVRLEWLKLHIRCFKNFETGVYFTELLKQFSQEIDPRKYYTDKLRLWIQAYTPDKRSLVEFKNEMLMGLYKAELKKTCLFLCLRSCGMKTRSRQC